MKDAVELMGAPERAAFDLSNEPEATVKAYGDSPFGRGCLVARRLVEAGTRVIEVTLDGWDTHENNNERTQALSKVLDPALTTAERETLDRIFAGRSPVKHWTGPFRMPLDGQIRVTSTFATRRCYNCAAGSTPTSYHGGMDMRANEGTPVHAPEAGVVEKVPKFGYTGTRSPSNRIMPSRIGIRLIRGVRNRSGRKPALR